MDDLDPRYEWTEIHTLSSKKPVRYVGRCLHTEVVPVESIVDGEVVAQLCQTCDEQLPAHWRP